MVVLKDWLRIFGLQKCLQVEKNEIRGVGGRTRIKYQCLSDISFRFSRLGWRLYNDQSGYKGGCWDLTTMSGRRQ